MIEIPNLMTTPKTPVKAIEGQMIELPSFNIVGLETVNTVEGKVFKELEEIDSLNKKAQVSISALK